MIENSRLIEAFEKQQIKASRPDYSRNLRIFEGLYREAKTLGVFPLKNPLEGIEVDNRVAGC